jgi:putative tryptophan/tyrosine transport system substrate-binding protein
MASNIGRRKFLATLGGAAAAWPLAARAQDAGKLRTVGFLGGATRSAYGPWTAALAQRLRELGWIEGRDVAIEYRWAAKHQERLTELAADLVQRKVDVIVTAGTPTTAAVKQLTTAIPIVFVTVNDPVGTGLVASLARPGGNVTGLSNQQADTAGKRMDLLRDALPGLGRLAIIGNADNPAEMLDMRNAQAAAHKLGLGVLTPEVRRGTDIGPAIEALKDRVDALMSFWALSRSPTRLKSTPWRSACGCRRCTVIVGSSTREA